MDIRQAETAVAVRLRCKWPFPIALKMRGRHRSRKALEGAASAGSAIQMTAAWRIASGLARRSITNRHYALIAGLIAAQRMRLTQRPQPYALNDRENDAQRLDIRLQRKRFAQTSEKEAGKT